MLKSKAVWFNVLSIIAFAAGLQWEWKEANMILPLIVGVVNVIIQQFRLDEKRKIESEKFYMSRQVKLGNGITPVEVIAVIMSIIELLAKIFGTTNSMLIEKISMLNKVKGGKHGAE